MKLTASLASAESAVLQVPPPSPLILETPGQSPPLSRGDRLEMKAAANVVAVRAPMLGTFYRAPAPGEPPYVEVGDLVREGDTIGLIDVMKLFTQINAGVSGRVIEILAGNATLVEYDQPLVLIESALSANAGEESRKPAV